MRAPVLSNFVISVFLSQNRRNTKHFDKIVNTSINIWRKLDFNTKHFSQRKKSLYNIIIKMQLKNLNGTENAEKFFFI